MKKNALSLRAAVAAVSSLFVLCSCGGSESSSGGGATHDGGFAPEQLTGNIRLLPKDANVHGTIILTNTPARVAYFNDGDETTGATTTGAYTGNFTYTKCGPNLVELKMDNIRSEPIETAADCHWTIIGYLTFIDENTIVYTGTETLVGDEGGGHNDPMGFGSGSEDGTDGDSQALPEKPNHFAGSAHDGGGTRNFSLNYTFRMGN